MHLPRDVFPSKKIEYSIHFTTTIWRHVDSKLKKLMKNVQVLHRAHTHTQPGCKQSNSLARLPKPFHLNVKTKQSKDHSANIIGNLNKSLQIKFLYYQIHFEGERNYCLYYCMFTHNLFQSRKCCVCFLLHIGKWSLTLETRLCDLRPTFC